MGLKFESRSAAQIDRLSESHQHAAIFGTDQNRVGSMDFARLERWLLHEAKIPAESAKRALSTIGGKLSELGLDHPSPGLIFQWVMELLEQMGQPIDDQLNKSLTLNLQSVEWSIYHPTGSLSGANQNPEATSQKLAAMIKSQFSFERVFQKDVVQAHHNGDFEVMHVGDVDRPDALFLTPEYVKLLGLPANGRAPGAGPAKHAHVLLSHLVRFTHELRVHVAGTIQWGFFNTFLLPFVEELSDRELKQFLQQLFFEFAQLEATRGVAGSRIHLDFDFDLPPYLAATPAIGPGGQENGKCYGDYERELERFNALAIEVMSEGDSRGCPFFNPHVSYHFNREGSPWTENHQNLFKLAARWGQPALRFSSRQRDCGPFGMKVMNHPDWLKSARNPSQWRGFSTCTIALNLPRLFWESEARSWAVALESKLSLMATAIRQKRMFLSRLMAYGNRGPLRFLRHKLGTEPFLRMDQAVQVVQLVGLGELADLSNGRAQSDPAGRMGKAVSIVESLRKSFSLLSQTHKWNVSLSELTDETVAYRMASLDLKNHGNDFSSYFLKGKGQTEPCYASLSQFLATVEGDWAMRLEHESKLHQFPISGLECTLFHREPDLQDPFFSQKLLDLSFKYGIQQVRIVPDMKSCMDCHWIFHDRGVQPTCPTCKSSLTVDFGWNQSQFSPVSTWVRGKRAEWNMRLRFDQPQSNEKQDQLPL